MLLTPRGEVRYLNKRAEVLLGCQSEHVVGRSFAECTVDPVETVSAAVRVWSRSSTFTPAGLVLRTGGAQPLRARCDGALLRAAADDGGDLLMVRITAAVEANKSFTSLNLRIQELSADNIRRRRAEAELAAQGEFLRVTLNSIGDAVMTTDRDGLVMFMNPIAVAMTGWTEDDARGRPSIDVFRIVDESTRHVVESPIVRALQTGMVVGLSNHTLLIARDGTEHHIDDSAAPIRDVDGHIRRRRVGLPRCDASADRWRPNASGVRNERTSSLPCWGTNCATRYPRS